MIYGRWVSSPDGNTSDIWSLTLQWCEGGHCDVNRNCTYEDSWGNMGASGSWGVASCSNSAHECCLLGVEVGVWVHTSRVLSS